MSYSIYLSSPFLFLLAQVQKVIMIMVSVFKIMSLKYYGRDSQGFIILEHD